MKVNWTYDRRDQRDNHEVELTEPEAWRHSCGDHQAGEPAVLTIFSHTANDSDDPPSGIQIGLGHPAHGHAIELAGTEDAGRRFEE